ncbi:DUF4198 domain-containing protein [Sphingomonas crocodyli]|uniref:DUF4198 domain-containing protein n=1 Tax=Sphingomonas crocodyli TaxID=1979270 RepID=UPI001F0C0541|nr:DUF4198 domain-containing protein [Sphingomonas crocodyli]
MIKTRILAALGAVSMLAMSGAAQAHHPWILPSSTMADGQDAWVTIDVGVSEALFAPERPAPLTNVKVWAPDGSEVAVEGGVTSKQRSSFDLHLTQQGTYKITNTGGGVMGGYKQNGEMKRLPRDITPDKIASSIPADATDVRINEMSSRVESFVTLGAPSEGAAFKPTGKGLELEPVGHMSDFVTDEPAKFRFLADGKPAANIAVTLIPGGTRYRDARGEISLTTDANGVVEIKWPEAGMYWLGASAKGAPTVQGATERRMSYAATIEVLTP